MRTRRVIVGLTIHARYPVDGPVIIEKRLKDIGHVGDVVLEVAAYALIGHQHVAGDQGIRDQDAIRDLQAKLQGGFLGDQRDHIVTFREVRPLHQSLARIRIVQDHAVREEGTVFRDQKPLRPVTEHMGFACHQVIRVDTRRIQGIAMIDAICHDAVLV